MPLQAADELAHDLGAFRIAEIEIVGDGQRPAADGGDVAPGFRHRLLAAFDRIGLAITRRDIDGERQSLRSVLHPHHRGIAAGPLHGIAQNDVIVLLPHPALRAQFGRCDQFFQRRPDADRRFHVARLDHRQRRRSHVRPIIDAALRRPVP